MGLRHLPVRSPLSGPIAHPRQCRVRAVVAYGLGAIIGIAALGLGAVSASAADRTIPLATAGNFAVLAGTTVANTGATVVTGNLGTSPGSAITGFPPGVITGANDPDDLAATLAQSDRAAAYNAAGNATELPCETAIAGNLGGVTLTPGVYCAGAAIGITGTLTLNFQGDPNAFFLFRINAALTTAAASAVHVINTGAGGETCAPNTFWALNGAASLGAATDFTGTILANGALTAGAGTTTTGRFLASGAVTVDSNAVSVCPNPIPPSANLSIAASGPSEPVVPGSYILYPITATNAGPDSALTASMGAILPAGLDFGAISAPAGWSCTTPPVGASGSVMCSAATFATGSANFWLTAKADPAIATGSTLSLSVAVTSSTEDPDQTDLSTTVDTQVIIPQATIVADPPTVILAPAPVTTPVTTPVTRPGAARVISGCISGRRFTVHLSTQPGDRHGTRITRAILLSADGHLLKTLKSTATSVDVDLRGLSRQRLTVRISTKPGYGSKITSFTRKYVTCS
jgi:uncharacterized repeat protein (TIGR01451 family)